MHLSDQEFSVLDALVRLHSDHGEYVGADAIASALPGEDATVVSNVLHGLARKQFVELNGREQATITEFGAAALKSM
ncbi:Mn-dependent DtxR family transcriptional regulator [Amorphus suaedae]